MLMQDLYSRDDLEGYLVDGFLLKLFAFELLKIVKKVAAYFFSYPFLQASKNKIPSFSSLFLSSTAPTSATILGWLMVSSIFLDEGECTFRFGKTH